MRYACLAHVHDKLSGHKGTRVVEVDAEDKAGAEQEALAILAKTIGNVTIRAVLENPVPLATLPLSRRPLPRVRYRREDERL